MRRKKQRTCRRELTSTLETTLAFLSIAVDRPFDRSRNINDGILAASTACCVLTLFLKHAISRPRDTYRDKVIICILKYQWESPLQPRALLSPSPPLPSPHSPTPQGIPTPHQISRGGVRMTSLISVRGGERGGGEEGGVGWECARQP